MAGFGDVPKRLLAEDEPLKNGRGELAELVQRARRRAAALDSRF
jgi:hypothetical protein